MRLKCQKGFTAVEAVIVLVIVAVVAFAGITILQTTPEETEQSKSFTSSSPTDSAAAPQIDNTADLDKALQTLDKNDPSSANNSDSSKLDSQLGAF